jgi:hypothetical protein
MRSISLTASLVVALTAPDHPLDAEGVWTLEMRVQSMRTITVSVPGLGKKTFHYLRYEIVNNTSEARQAVPAFELVTHDKPATYKEVIKPDVFKAIVKQEAPDGKLDLKDSATVAKKATPPSKKDAAPQVVNGIAVWEGVDPMSNRFSVYVAGLSNGRVTDEMKNVRRKTLQLNFKSDGETIRYIAPPQWLYRIDKGEQEKKDKEPKPQPKQPMTEKKPNAQDEYIAAFEAKFVEFKEFLKEHEAQVKQAREKYQGAVFQLKNRPAGDTPELQRHDFERSRELLRDLRELQAEYHRYELRLAEHERVLNELRRKNSQR